MSGRHGSLTIFARAAFLSILLLALLGLLPIQLTQTSALAQTPPSLRGDPNFRIDSLSQEMQTWHTRLLQAMASSNNTVTNKSGSGDLYTLGRYLGNYSSALLLALRATGDLQFLDRTSELWELARADLHDGWCDGTDQGADGYLNWVWISDDEYDPYHWCKDLHQMDEAMTHGAVAALAYALYVNRDLKPEYAERADFWINHLQNHFLAKWYARAGSAEAAWESDAGFYKRLTHPRANQMALAYYMWKITGDTFFEQRALSIEQQLLNHVELNPLVPLAYQWKHQVAGTDQGYQRINYAQYMINRILEMNAEQFGGFAADAEMTHYMSTFRDVAFSKFGPPYTQMAYRVDGAETTGFDPYLLLTLAKWDNSGALMQIASDKYTADNYGRGVGIASAALYTLSTRTDAPAEETPAPSPSPTVTPTAVPTNSQTPLPTPTQAVPQAPSPHANETTIGKPVISVVRKGKLSKAKKFIQLLVPVSDGDGIVQVKGALSGKSTEFVGAGFNVYGGKWPIPAKLKAKYKIKISVTDSLGQVTSLHFKSVNLAKILAAITATGKPKQLILPKR